MTELDAFVAESKTLRSKVAKGTITLDDLTKALAEPEPSALPVPKKPLPAVITSKQKEALERLEEVFGSVVPEEARSLNQFEVNLLMEERVTLDEVESLAKTRKASIRTTLLNHFDTETNDYAPEDKEGHKLIAAKAPSTTHGKSFSWEISNRGGTLDAEALKELDEAGLLDHDVYLSMTTPVRVLDEHKVMLALQKHPDLIETIGKAVTRTSKVGSLFVRPTKEED